LSSNSAANQLANATPRRSPWFWVPSLYFAEGIPYVVVMTVAVIMYKRLGVSNTEIALYTSWLYLPWVIKPFWSPLVDLFRTKRWWIVVMQLLIGAGLAGVAFTIPTTHFLQYSLAFLWLLAFSSATHDIAADGFYMLGLSSHEQAWFVGIRSTTYRLAMIAGQGLLVMFAGAMEVHHGLPEVEGDRSSRLQATRGAKGDYALVYSANGRFVFLTGQGAGRRNLVSVDPRWLTLTHAEDDFSAGLKQWITFKPVGPATRYRRQRIPGPPLVDHPTEPNAKVLHLRKPDNHDADGALWNFPNGVKGTLTLRLMPNSGFGGASIVLADRSFKPTDVNAERLAVFAATIGPDGKLGDGPKLSLGKWHSLTFAWDLRTRNCIVSVDGRKTRTLKQLNTTGNGISYLHLRSKATQVDAAGFYVESASVDVGDPVAPPLTDEQKRALLDGYIPSYYTPPPERKGARNVPPIIFKDDRPQGGVIPVG